MKKPSWYRILEVVRSVSEAGEVNSRVLADEAEMDPADASAWLCKLTRWGYLRRSGRSELGGKMVRYELTKHGAAVKAPKEKREFKKRTYRSLRIAANPPRNQG